MCWYLTPFCVPLPPPPRTGGRLWVAVNAPPLPCGSSVWSCMWWEAGPPHPRLWPVLAYVLASVLTYVPTYVWYAAYGLRCAWPELFHGLRCASPGVDRSLSLYLTLLSRIAM
eukprot:TRINITY_DN57492_c0_g1_i1.p1 TRINITY_DN57492_c0_g1~~TRINITY_DN57492_c0_g1_i1.p1  ORF type:complete len:113 (-),score=1.85 TRINITY_DN57492_c0_g1_i1:25-363(-)